MGSSKYKLVSPGVQIKEIDNSQVPAELQDAGPVVIGRAQRGPAMRPVRVNSYSEFIEYFGNSSTNNVTNDVWRENVILGPSYGALAAEASLANKNSLTFIRLLGTEHAEAASAGKAGWKVGALDGTAREGGAFGLFIFPSGSYPVGSSNELPGGVTFDDLVSTGTLAAVWYLQTGSIALKGRLYATSDDTQTGTAGLFLSNDKKEFRVLIKNENGVNVEDITFNFTPSEDKFARKVFNTNPTLVNSNVYNTTKNYFLGETFEDFIINSDEMASLRAAPQWVGVILALKNQATGDDLASRQLPSQNSRTGWYFSQDVGNYSTFEVDNTQKLFRFHSLDSGEWNQANIKISIKNVRESQNEFDRYGSFDVIVRKINDSDNAPEILEYFNDCNLNPSSDSYIAKKIGDKYVVYSTTEERNLEYGEFDNRSKFIRVEMNESVALGATTQELLPFGVYGPVKFKNFAFSSGSIGLVGSRFGKFTNVESQFTAAFAMGSGSLPDNMWHNYAQYSTGSVNFGGAASSIKTASVVIPYPRLRMSTLTGALITPTNAYFGVFTDDSNDKFSYAVRDLVKILPAGVDSFGPQESEGTDYAWKFTLDDLKFVAGSTTDVEWSSGSRQLGTSLTAAGSYTSPLTGNFNSFTTLLAGGFDGFDVKEIEPIRNSGLLNKNSKTSYAYNTVNRAIEILRHPEDVEFETAVVPGVTNVGLTKKLIDVCSERGDALAIIDLEDDFEARSESTNTLAQRRANVKNAISSLKTRGLNTNYACAYFPWVQVRDSETGVLIYVPPSVVALGAFAYNDKVAGPHIAPAGFNRGSMTLGHSGLVVQNVSYKLLSKERDDLYKVNINPIAVLQNEVVIMGQKTLQVTASALDRINVRRGLLQLKRQFSKIASRLIFEPNINATWDRFVGQARPILDDLKARLGLDDYKLVLDATTTTADLRDRNIIYGKVFLKPVKAAEYFLLDFNITSSGASFAGA